MKIFKCIKLVLFVFNILFIISFKWIVLVTFCSCQVAYLFCEILINLLVLSKESAIRVYFVDPLSGDSLSEVDINGHFRINFILLLLLNF